MKTISLLEDMGDGVYDMTEIVCKDPETGWPEEPDDMAYSDDEYNISDYGEDILEQWKRRCFNCGGRNTSPNHLIHDNGIEKMSALQLYHTLGKCALYIHNPWGIEDLTLERVNCLDIPDYDCDPFCYDPVYAYVPRCLKGEYENVCSNLCYGDSSKSTREDIVGEYGQEIWELLYDSALKYMGNETTPDPAPLFQAVLKHLKNTIKTESHV